MFLKKDRLEDVKSIIERNTGMTSEQFLKEYHMPEITNIKPAVELTKNFIKEHPECEIVCVGDYDFDGISATSIVYWGFQKLGRNIRLRIPHRMSEGYGLSEKIIDELNDKSLVITVDNGITAVSAIQKAKKRGMTVIVMDHHLPKFDKDGNAELPPADIIVDPHIYEDEFKPVCGAALAYYFVKEMFPDALLKPLLTLASVATVTDVMPLVMFNRTLVKDGLAAINNGCTVPGLASLIKEKELSVITEEDYGFLIGPVFNAPGRLYDDGGKIGLQVLNARRSDAELPWKVKNLVKINEKRKNIVKESMIIAESLVTEERPIVICHPSFEEGIVGILAGHLTEKYNTPCIVFTKTAEGIYKGSGRSTEHIHLKQKLDKIKDTMLGYGGHAGAAGLSVNPDRFEEFKQAFVKTVGVQDECSSDVYYDLDITENDIEDLAEELQIYAPYGEGNPKPVFHIKLDLSDGDFMIMGDGTHFSISMPRYKVMGFGLLQKYREYECPKKIDAIVYISNDWFRGVNRIKLELIDFTAL